MKTFREAIQDYLTLRRGLGFKLKKHSRMLEEFASFLEQKGALRYRPGWLCSGRRNHNTYSRRNGLRG
jgi:hypothetical protein